MNTEEQKQQTEKKKKGCFRIAKEAFDVLITNKATAWELGAYLVLARHTDESGKFSTAGHKKIYEAIGASPGTEKNPGIGRRLVKKLMEMGQSPDPNGNGTMLKRPLGKLIYQADEWSIITDEEIPDTKHELYPVNFVLNDFSSEEWVWFPNELVDGYKRFKSPLKKLKQSGDVATRLLFLSYRVNNMEDFGGIPPLSNFYNKYVTSEHLTTAYGFAFYKVTDKKQFSAFNLISLPALGITSFSENPEEKVAQLKPFWDALSSLESQGFMYEMVTVMDNSPDSADARPVYELHNKSYSTNIGEEGLSRRIDRILAKIVGTGREFRVADDLGRYYGNYPVISRVGILPHVVGIYRLRFRISNPKNYPVKAAWQRIRNDQNEMEYELEQLEVLLASTFQFADVLQTAPSPYVHQCELVSQGSDQLEDDYLPY
ncbi:MAG: hypothetical protein PHH28_08955 [Desulfuromonadaceae bacterium]|nr:hypothetical protein [Desulfuromonadaceae bacterium]